jgi:hypothetical protein
LYSSYQALSSELGISTKKLKNKIDANFIGSLSFWADGTKTHSLMSTEVETRAPYGLREITRNARESVKDNTPVHRH